MLQQDTTNPERVLKVLATKRKDERVKSSFSGAILANGSFLCHCVIKDVSSSGMQLSVPKGTDLPEFFDLKTPAIPDMLSVKQAWSRGTSVGVTIVKVTPVQKAS